MRNYVAKKNNPYWLPHDLYMQMLYVIRDYERGEEENIKPLRKKQREAVSFAFNVVKEEYKKRPVVYGVLDPLRAFFEYPYYSVMFALKSGDKGAGRRGWNLFRSRLTHLVAERVGLF